MVVEEIKNVLRFYRDEFHYNFYSILKQLAVFQSTTINHKAGSNHWRRTLLSIVSNYAHECAKLFIPHAYRGCIICVIDTLLAHSYPFCKLSASAVCMVMNACCAACIFQCFFASPSAFFPGSFICTCSKEQNNR